MAWGVAIEAGMGLLSNLLGADASIKANEQAQKRQYKYNLKLQKQNQGWLEAQTLAQRQFETEMSNTAHQREIADLKSAGLNPILSANSGATTPSSGIPSSGLGSVGLTDDGNQVTQSRVNAIQLAQLAINKQIANAQTQQIKAQTQQTKAQTKGQEIENRIKIFEENIKRFESDTYGNWRTNEIEQMGQNINKTIEEINKLKSETKNIGTQIKLNEQIKKLEEIKTKYEGERLRSEIGKTKAETDLTKQKQVTELYYGLSQKVRANTDINTLQLVSKLPPPAQKAYLLGIGVSGREIPSLMKALQLR